MKKIGDMLTEIHVSAMSAHEIGFSKSEFVTLCKHSFVEAQKLEKFNSKHKRGVHSNTPLQNDSRP